MRRFTAFAALYRAPIASPALYSDVAHQWRGLTGRYLFILLLLSTITIAAPTLYVAFQLLSLDDASLKTFPTIIINRGTAIGTVPQPYILQNSANHPLFILDTTNHTTWPSERNAYLLLTAHEFIIETPLRRQRFPLDSITNTTIKPSDLAPLAALSLLRWFLLPALILVYTLYSFIFRLLFALFLTTFIAFPLNFLLRGRVPFHGLFRITIMAMTAEILLETFCICFQFSPWPWFIFPLIPVLYLLIGTLSAALATRPTSTALNPALAPSGTDIFPS